MTPTEDKIIGVNSFSQISVLQLSEIIPSSDTDVLYILHICSYI